MSKPTEQRIRDFAAIASRILDEHKLSLRNTDEAVHKLLPRLAQAEGSAKASAENLNSIGRALWLRAAEGTKKEAAQDDRRTCWHKLIRQLHQRCPRASTPGQWVDLAKLLDDPAARPMDVPPAWKTFLERWVAPPLPLALPAETEAALAPFRAKVVSRFNEISFSGFGGSGPKPTEDGGKAELCAVYVDLDVTDENTARSSPAPDEARERERQRVPALQQLALHPRLVLIGLPGSGKTTLLKFFSLCLAQCGLRPEQAWLDHLQHWSPEETDLIPVFVELRQFANALPDKLPSVDGGQHLLDHFCGQLNTTPLKKCREPLEAAFDAGRVILFLDGLDEVTGDERRRFVLKSVQALADTTYPRCRVVVTCRPRSYEDPNWKLSGFAEAHLLELTPPSVERFIERFYTEVARRNLDWADKRADRTEKLKLATQRPELKELASNPFMLSVMAWLHRYEELPRKRAAILNRLAEMVLAEWEQLKIRDEAAPSGSKTDQSLTALLDKHQLDMNSLRAILCRLAFAARLPAEAASQEAYAKTGRAALSEVNLRDEIAKLPDAETHSLATRKRWAQDVVDAIDQRTGLLVSEGGGSFSMAYKFQEFLAGEHLTSRYALASVARAFRMHAACGTYDQVVARLVGTDGYWEEVVKWSAAIQAHVKKNYADAQDLASALCLGDRDEAVALRRAVVAGEILLERGLADLRTQPPHGPECLKRVRRTLDDLMVSPSLPAKLRAQAGIARGWLEDLPFGVGLKDGLPGIDFPTGLPPQTKFKLGETGREVPIPQPYYLSRYPVTVAQYAAFVVADGYGEKGKSFWSPEGWKWRTGNGITGPEDYGSVFQTPNHPRVGVSWYEAEAFCAWLTSELRSRQRAAAEATHRKSKTGNQKSPLTIRLPTEAEWEQAARWNLNLGKADDRKFPWGNSEKDLAERCNCSLNGLGHTSAVGLFPQGLAECGAADLSGNVWEWCENWYDEKTKSARVLRGGSWGLFDPDFLSSSYRSRNTPDFRSDYVGFRVVRVGGGSG
jgi:formylglycine-generating enzyme required for sulfatase activity